jgi:hypothetical protein
VSTTTRSPPTAQTPTGGTYARDDQPHRVAPVHIPAPDITEVNVRQEPLLLQRRAANELLETPDALLTRSHLRELGLERRAIDAVFRALPVIALPGYSRPLIRVRDYLALVHHHTYGCDRVRLARETSNSQPRSASLDNR